MLRFNDNDTANTINGHIILFDLMKVEAIGVPIKNMIAN